MPSLQIRLNQYLQSKSEAETDPRILLHSCCAPCSCAIIDVFLETSVVPTIFFYNPNIHPHQEYLKRKEENIRYAAKRNLSFVDGDYDAENWHIAVQSLEMEPERGKRCVVCFQKRLTATAEYAFKKDFQLFATSLAISRWKNIDQVDTCGEDAASKYPGLNYFRYPWHQYTHKMNAITKEEIFYKQNYCGCVYSKKY